MHINVTADMLRNTGGFGHARSVRRISESLGYVQRYDKPGNLASAIVASKLQ